MKILNNKEWIFKLTPNKLQVLDAISLKEKLVLRSPLPTSFVLHETSLIYGTCIGSLYKLNLKTLESTKIKKSCGIIVNALFYLENFLYAGYNDGAIIKYSFQKMDTFKTYKHLFPITNIVSNGEIILISDENNRVTCYPSMVVYDIQNPILLYKYYIFIAEKNILYCLTRSSLSSYFQTETSIKKYQFTDNGGIVFLMLYDCILILDFNNKVIINQINKSYKDFVYDESRNRIVGFYDKGKEIIERVLDNVYEEMENIIFEENEIAEKKIKITEDEDYDVINNDYNDKDEYYEDEEEEEEEEEKEKEKEKEKESKSRKKTKKVPEKLKSLFYDDEEINSLKSKENFTKSKRLRRSRFESNSEEEVEEKVCKMQINVFPINKEQDKLLFYNEIGYLISIKEPEYNKIELRYHDRMRQTIEYKDFNNCHLGTFHDNNILVCNNTNAYFFGTNIWDKELNKENVIIAMNDKHVIISDKLTVVYNLQGEEVFNFYISDISIILTNNNYILIFSYKITIINLFKSTLEYSLPCKASWGYFCNDRLYYKLDSDIYILYKRLSCRIFKDIKKPLAIVRGKLVCLNNNIKILPVPHLDFIDFPTTFKNFEDVNEIFPRETISYQGSKDKGNNIERDEQFLDFKSDDERYIDDLSDEHS